ncbi:MAG TPA: iron-sulfur cluster assembly scaffold protein, partial [Allosphingosinicella sp.]
LGRLDHPQASSEKSSAVCGSRVAVDVALDAEGRVAALGQEVKACALGQASASLMAAHAVGRTAAEIQAARDSLADFLSGKSDGPGDWPGLEVFAEARRVPARHGSILLAFDAAAEAAARAKAG